MACTSCGASLPADARFCPGCGSKQETVVWHLSGPGGQRQGSLAEHAALVAETAGNWHLWRDGWAGWKPWEEVPEAVSALDAHTPEPEPLTPPPPPTATWPDGYRPPAIPDRLRAPEEVWHLHGAGEQVQGTLRELRAKVRGAPDVAWHLWKQGMEGWVPWADVVS